MPCPASNRPSTATDWPRNYAPSYGDLREALGSTYGDGRNRVGWRLEAFVSDEVLDCRQGYVARPVPDLDAGLFESFPAWRARFRQLCESTSMLPKVSNSTKRSYSRKH